MFLEHAFRELRTAWFNRHLRSHAHEREWEDDEHKERRERNNQGLKFQYDTDTEAIINGVDRPIAPTCGADLN